MMKKFIKNILDRPTIGGFNPLRYYRNRKLLKIYYQEYSELKKQKGQSKLFELNANNPRLNDKFHEAGSMKGHYFHQDLYVAKLIFKDNPKKHVDIGSRTDGFVAHVASYRDIEIMDIRKMESKVEGITFKQCNLMELPNELINYCDSISSLHAIEHFGLGRYNDPIDYFGYQKAIENIYMMLNKNGKFYFSVPIGPQRIEFNAHRIFSIKYLTEFMSEKFIIHEFSYVDDNGEFHKNQDLNSNSALTNFGCNYGCGIFVLVKKG